MKNWQTTIIGICAGAAVILQNAYAAGGRPDWGHIGIGILVMALGVVAKDAFGGNNGNTGAGKSS